jgi:hypothetical protein
MMYLMIPAMLIADVWVAVRSRVTYSQVMNIPTYCIPTIAASPSILEVRER